MPGLLQPCACGFKHARWRGQKLHDVFADGKALCEAQNFAVQAVGTDGFDRASLAAADEASCFGITTPHDNAVGTASGRRPNRWLSIGAAACVTMLSIKRPRGCILTGATVMVLALISAQLIGVASGVASFDGLCPYYK